MDSIPPEFESLLLRDGEPEATIEKYLLLCSESRIRQDYSLLSTIFPQETNKTSDEDQENEGNEKRKEPKANGTTATISPSSSSISATVTSPNNVTQQYQQQQKQQKQSAWETTPSFNAFINALILENRDRADSFHNLQQGRAWPVYAGFDTVEKTYGLAAGAVEEQFLLWIARLSPGWRARIRRPDLPLPSSSGAAFAADVSRSRRYKLSTSVAKIFRDRDAVELRNRIVQDFGFVGRMFEAAGPGLRDELQGMIKAFREHFFMTVTPGGGGSGSSSVSGGSSEDGDDSNNKGEKGAKGKGGGASAKVNVEAWNKTVKRLEDIDREEKEARDRAEREHEAKEKAMLHDLYAFMTREEPECPLWFDLEIDFGS